MKSYDLKTATSACTSVVLAKLREQPLSIRNLKSAELALEVAIEERIAGLNASVDIQAGQGRWITVKVSDVTDGGPGYQRLSAAHEEYEV